LQGLHPANRFRRCHFLREDPELAQTIEQPRRDQAIAECTAHELVVAPGSWMGHSSLVPPDAIGLLILNGLLIRRVGLDGRFGAELLGEGDLLRPWQGERESSTLTLTTGWSIVERTRFAVLDGEFISQVPRFPELTASLIDRATQRSRHLAVNMAIVHQARVDVRLHMLLWHLAGRWGRVRSDGTVLRVRLTHAVLADLVAARRPTVSSALSDLARRGRVLWVDDAWLLKGEPPGELLDLTGSPTPPLEAPPSGG
jgi:CRP/FNR family transcriptional regulator, cyclic AMP receptor protein